MFFMCGAEWRVKGNDGDGGLQGKLKGGNKFLSLAAAGWMLLGGDPSCDPGLGMERISCAGKKCRAVPCSDQPGDNRAVLILYLLWLTFF